MSYPQDGSGGYVDPATSEGSTSNVLDTGMFSLSPIFLKGSLIAGESGGVPGFESTSGATSSAPPITSASSWWDNVKNEMGSVVTSVENYEKGIYNGVKDITKTVYSDASSAVGTVYADVSSPVTSALTSTYWYAIGAVVVLGAVIYFAGKSGALKVNAII